MIIYKVTNKDNNKSYIGKTIHSLHQRQTEHFNDAFNHKSKSYFHNALRKYGKELFEWSVICECDDIKNLNILEIYFIDLHNTFLINGYNMTKGGEGGDILSNHPNKKEIYKKLSEARMGDKNPMYGKPGTFLGKKHSEETKRKLKECKKGKYIGKDNPNWKGVKYICPKCSTPMYSGSKLCRSCYEKSIIGENNPVYGMRFKQKKIKCPHCGKIGGQGNMKRYHFNNCKEKNKNEKRTSR
jgi:group I intron endonuclease